MNDDGLTNSAILLLSLGEDEAAEVMKHLSPKEVQKLGQVMASLKAVPHERVESVLAEFEADAQDQSALGADPGAYLRRVLHKALGADKAGYVLDRMLQAGDTRGIEELKWMDAETVAELVKNEHPQIIASVLVHLERDHAGEILGYLAEHVRNDVVLRIATLDAIQPNALRELNEVLAKVLSGGGKLKKAALGGVRPAAEILNFMPSVFEASVVESVREHDPDLAQSILDEMFVFENLTDFDDSALQLVLREVQTEQLVVALKGASENLRERVFANMSQRAAEILREDLESRGPVRISEVEAQQKEILKLVRRLADEGQVVLGAKGEDAFV